MRIAFHLPSLAGGGAERCVVDLCRVMPDAIVVVEDARGEFLEEVPAHQLVDAACKPEANRFARARTVARALRAHRVDVVVSLLSPAVGLLAATLAGTPFVHWLQNPVSETLRPLAPLPVPVQRLFLQFVIKRSLLLATSSPGLALQWEEFGAPPRRWATVPNAVDTGRIRAPAERERVPSSREVRLLTVGRLAAQKRQDVLIDAVAGLPTRGWHLDILGDGELRDQLTSRISAHGLEDRVRLRGFVHDVDQWFQRADVFVLSSDFEGFGNVLVQALAAGLPIVSTDAPDGPRFILQDGRLGTLVGVGDTHGLSAALGAQIDRVRRVASDTSLRVARAKEFSAPASARQLERVIEASLTGAPVSSHA